jgi:hypothetical protein
MIALSPQGIAYRSAAVQHPRLFAWEAIIYHAGVGASIEKDKNA